MTFFARLIVLWLLMVGVGLPSAWAQVDVGTLKKGVVKITAEFSNARKIGTGFISAKSKKHLFVVTASHVVEGEAEAPHSIQVTFYTHQEESFPAKIVKKEGGDPRGLALLKVGGDVPDDVQVQVIITTITVLSLSYQLYQAAFELAKSIAAFLDVLGLSLIHI